MQAGRRGSGGSSELGVECLDLRGQSVDLLDVGRGRLEDDVAHVGGVVVVEDPGEAGDQAARVQCRRGCHVRDAHAVLLDVPVLGAQTARDLLRSERFQCSQINLALVVGELAALLQEEVVLRLLPDHYLALVGTTVQDPELASAELQQPDVREGTVGVVGPVDNLSERLELPACRDRPCRPVGRVQDVGDLVGEDPLTGRLSEVEPGTAEEDVVARGERLRGQVGVEACRLRAAVHPNMAQGGAERALHAVHGPGPPAANRTCVERRYARWSGHRAHRRRPPTLAAGADTGLRREMTQRIRWRPDDRDDRHICQGLPAEACERIVCAHVRGALRRVVETVRRSARQPVQARTRQSTLVRSRPLGWSRCPVDVRGRAVHSSGPSDERASADAPTETVPLGRRVRQGEPADALSLGRGGDDMARAPPPALSLVTGPSWEPPKRIELLTFSLRVRRSAD